jgi:hypothetical protein
LGCMRRYGASCSTDKVAQLNDALKEAKVRIWCSRVDCVSYGGGVGLELG